MADTYAKLLGLPEQDPLDKARKPGHAMPLKSEPNPASILLLKTKPEQSKMSTNPQTHLSTSRSSNSLVDKPEKYTTHLEPSLIKRLKLFATERDMKDYQVVRDALLLYFDKNK